MRIEGYDVGDAGYELTALAKIIADNLEAREALQEEIERLKERITELEEG